MGQATAAGGGSTTAAASSNLLQVHHNFRWVLFSGRAEPASGLLQRHLRRRLIAAARDRCAMRVVKMQLIFNSSSMLALLAVRPKFTQPACCAAAAAIDRYLLRARARPQQQKPAGRRCCCRSTGQTDGRTHDRSMKLNVYYADRIKIC